MLPGLLQIVKAPRRQPCSALTFLWPETHTHASKQYYRFIEYNAIDISVRMNNERLDYFSTPLFFSLVAPGCRFSASEGTICQNMNVVWSCDASFLWLHIVNIVHVAKFIVAHLLLSLLAVIVVLLILLLFAEGRTWQRGGAGDDVTRCHITGL